jgi:hypothetical protein
MNEPALMNAVRSLLELLGKDTDGHWKFDSFPPQEVSRRIRRARWALQGQRRILAKRELEARHPASAARDKRR